MFVTSAHYSLKLRTILLVFSLQVRWEQSILGSQGLLCLAAAFNPTQHGVQEPGAQGPPLHSSSWEASQGGPESSASGSYCLKSLSLLKVFQECGGLTHSLP